MRATPRVRTGSPKTLVQGRWIILPHTQQSLGVERSWQLLEAGERTGQGRGKGEEGTGWGEEGEDRRDLGEIFKWKELPRAVLLSDWFQAIFALALP